MLLSALHLGVLASVPSLRKLLLEQNKYVDDLACPDSQLQQQTFSTSTLPNVLQQMTGLADLQLSCISTMLDVQGHALDAVSTLQHLQCISLTVQLGLDLSILGRLPSSLTALELSGDTGGVEDAQADDVEDWVIAADVPLLQGLTGLRHLFLRDIFIDCNRLTVLRTAPLTFLHLENVVGYPEEDGLALLGALGQLTGLCHLALGANIWETPLEPQHFSTVTAASVMTTLQLWGRDEFALPKEAWRLCCHQAAATPRGVLLSQVQSKDCRSKSSRAGCTVPVVVCCQTQSWSGHRCARYYTLPEADVQRLRLCLVLLVDSAPQRCSCSVQCQSMHAVFGAVVGSARSMHTTCLGCVLHCARNRVQFS